MRIHTPEPWHECAEGECGCGQILGPGSVYITTVKDPATRRRIVACVNACRGLPTDELEQKGLVAAIGTQLLDVEQQRDGWQTALGTVLATIPDAEIIRASGTVGDAVAYFTQLHQQRDELLAALEEVHRVASGSNMTHNMMVIRDQCADAIAKAKGGAA
ncbi:MULTISPECIES: hypothetical protein [Aeromonas]|uniref:hypothetical protein n=1 Tax=Aeromonas TaxID=642 RepID=UPI0035A5753D